MSHARTLRRHVLSILMATLAAVTAVVATSTSAQAWNPFYYSDSFTVPSAWFTTVSGSGTSAVITNGVSGTAPGSGYLGEIASSGSGFASVGQTIHKTGGDAGCRASISLRTVTQAAVVNVEVIRPSDWTYQSLKQVSLPAYSSWQQVTTPTWSQPGAGDFVFRVSVLGGGTRSYHTVDVDNLSVSCETIG